MSILATLEKLTDMQLYKKINNVAGWLVFLIGAIVYALTLESSGSFWDCGEFVPGAYKLQVVHAPGAPFFLLIGRLFTLLAMGDTLKVAWMVNFMSGVATAASVMFAFWSMTMLLKKVFLKTESSYTTANIVTVIGAAFIAALCGLFLDSLWFSAVEGEVYALSQFFMSIIVWAILKWDASDSPYADRWIIFIAYMVGLSIGVHLLSLLALPFIAVVYYHKRAKKQSIFGEVIAAGIGFVILGFAMKFVISYTQAFMAGFDKLFVNSFGLPFYSGVIFYFILLVSIIIGLLLYSKQKGWYFVNLGVLSAAFMYIGYLSYALVPVRASANPPINMNRPTDPFSIKSYVDREQYGDRPLVYGPNYTATQNDITEVVNTGEKFYKGKDKYEFGGEKSDYKFKDDVCNFFPRLGFWMEEPKKQAYRVWLSPNCKLIDRGNDNAVVQYYTADQRQQAEAVAQQRNMQQAGRYLVVDDITTWDNWRFFFSYQLGYMYFRYFMWNFSGRQDDIQGMFNNDNGRWISGIPFIDNLGIFYLPQNPQTDLSQSMATNPGRNKFYMIPFLLGLIGLIYTLLKNEKTFAVIFVLFLVTGIFQIIYQNEPPFEPRERDYAVAGSFLTYCFWIAFGIVAIIKFLQEKIKTAQLPIAVGVLAVCFSAPYLMGSQGWDDHTRHERYTARDLAIDYLESCEPNAILFTQGDNDTYPLWYAQEVENIRPDVRVINLSLLGVDWYIQQLKYWVNKSAPIKTTMTDDKIVASNRDQVFYSKNNNLPDGMPVDLKEVIKFLASDDASAKVGMGRDGDTYNFYPTKTFSLDIDTNKVKTMNMVDPSDYGKLQAKMVWTIGNNTLLKNDLMTLDIVANNIMTRPIYFAVSVSPDTYLGMDKYFQLEGMTYRIVPIENAGGAQRAPVRTDKAFNVMMNKFRFGGIEATDRYVYVDENINRMTMNLRGNYGRLAQALIAKGEKEKALQVIEHSLKNLPAKKLGYSFFMAEYPTVYYLNGKNQEGRKLVEAMWAQADNEIAYWQRAYKAELEKAQRTDDRGYLDLLQQGIFIENHRDLQEQLYMMQILINSLQPYETPEYMQQLQKRFMDSQNKFRVQPLVK